MIEIIADTVARPIYTVGEFSPILKLREWASGPMDEFAPYWKFSVVWEPNRERFHYSWENLIDAFERCERGEATKAILHERWF